MCYQKTLACMTYYSYHKQICTHYYEFVVLPECSIDRKPYYTLPRYKGTHQYTGCPRRNVPDFARVFFMLKYNDITQNTYVQS